MADHYETLGVPRDASAAEIKAAYRRAAKENHPDKVGGDGKTMALVNKAYATLGDGERRANYDATGNDGEPQSAEGAARAMFHELLMAATTAPADQNCIKWASQKLEEAQAGARSQLRQQKRDLERLTKRRAAVKVKAGENLVHSIIDQQLRGIEQNITKLNGHLEATALVEMMLAEYESSESPARRDPFDHPMIEELMFGLRGARNHFGDRP